MSGAPLCGECVATATELTEMPLLGAFSASSCDFSFIYFFFFLLRVSVPFFGVRDRNLFVTYFYNTILSNLHTAHHFFLLLLVVVGGGGPACPQDV